VTAIRTAAQRLHVGYVVAATLLQWDKVIYFVVCSHYPAALALVAITQQYSLACIHPSPAAYALGGASLYIQYCQLVAVEYRYR